MKAQKNPFKPDDILLIESDSASGWEPPWYVDLNEYDGSHIETLSQNNSHVDYADILVHRPLPRGPRVLQNFPGSTVRMCRLPPCVFCSVMTMFENRVTSPTWNCLTSNGSASKTPPSGVR